MAETLSLNQFAPNVPLAGMYVYMANLPQLHNVIVASTVVSTAPLVCGAIVTLDSTSTNTSHRTPRILEGRRLCTKLYHSTEESR